MSKGLHNEGHVVEVIIIRPTERHDSDCVNPSEGIIDGVSFRYMVQNNVWSNRSKSGKLLGIAEGFINSVKYIRKSHGPKENVVVMDTLSSLSISFAFFILSKFSKFKFVIHLDEYPWPHIFRDNYNPLYRSVFYAIKYKLYDGLIVMTKELSAYYQSLKRGNAQICHIPMTVDSERFKLVIDDERSYLVTYCGSMSIYKDGVDLLIESFSLFVRQNPGYKLQLIGKTEGNPDFPSLKKLVTASGIEGSVIFTGETASEKIPLMLVESDILVLSRRNNIQAQGGFPTKLGEYLLTGKPVVLTSFGEVTDYLTDGKNAFITVDATAESFSEKLDFVSKNYTLAQKIGLAGKEKAIQSFDYKTFSKKLSDFINHL